MGRFKLAVDHDATQLTEITGEIDEGDLRGIGHQREHALAKECPAQIDAIESAHETSVLIPDLNTRGKALTVEFGIGLDDLRTEPSTLLLVAILGRRTSADDAIEILVDGDTITILTEDLSHGVTDVDFPREDDKTLHGTVPEGLLAIAEGEPGEETVGIGQQQAVDGEVATYGHEPIFFTKMRVREPEFII